MVFLKHDPYRTEALMDRHLGHNVGAVVRSFLPAPPYLLRILEQYVGIGQEKVPVWLFRRVFRRAFRVKDWLMYKAPLGVHLMLRELSWPRAMELYKCHERRILYSIWYVEDPDDVPPSKYVRHALTELDILLNNTDRYYDLPEHKTTSWGVMAGCRFGPSARSASSRGAATS